MSLIFVGQGYDQPSRFVAEKVNRNIIHPEICIARGVRERSTLPSGCAYQQEKVANEDSSNY
jgi:hypothetical protein